MSDLPTRRQPIHMNVNLGREPGEVIYFDHDGVTVTSDRVVCDSTTYPIRGITKVEAEEVASGDGRWLMIAMVCVPLIAFAGIFIARDYWPVGIVFLLAAVAAAVLIFMFRRPKTTFNVVIHTAGGQGEVISTPNERVADEIIEAINTAIANYRP